MRAQANIRSTIHASEPPPLFSKVPALHEPLYLSDNGFSHSFRRPCYGISNLPYPGIEDPLEKRQNYWAETPVEVAGSQCGRMLIG